MKKKPLIVVAGVVLAAVGLLSQTTQPAQQGVGGVTTFKFVPGQEAGTLGQVQDQWITLPAATNGAGPTVSGRPFSATEESKTVQTLGDGTEIVNSETRQFFRDVVGRTRTEQTAAGRKLIVIRDPANGFSARLDSEAKTATRNAMPAGGRGARGGAGPVTAADTQAAEVAIQEQYVRLAKPSSASTASAGPTVTTDEGVATKKKRGAANVNTEDLGVQSINGVPAVGTRRTQIIPAGQIGNNREIRVVNERWYSEDLQMVVKTVNTDPRFGVTTYELTNISRDNPDPSLFQIPADYAVTEGGRRGGVMTKQQ
jgi:hypothetical protein